MKKSKYIIFVDGNGMELPVVFSPILTHDQIKVNGFKPVSAGFCASRGKDFYSIWGESVSLKLKSRPEDAEILNRLLEYDC